MATIKGHASSQDEISCFFVPFSSGVFRLWVCFDHLTSALKLAPSRLGPVAAFAWPGTPKTEQRPLLCGIVHSSFVALVQEVHFGLRRSSRNRMAPKPKTGSCPVSLMHLGAERQQRDQCLFLTTWDLGLKWSSRSPSQLSWVRKGKPDHRPPSSG